MSLVKVKNSTFVRDTGTMALINQDNNGLTDYMNKRRVMEAQRSEINNMKVEMNTIKSDVSEIKDLLYQLLSKGSHG
jgi:hypothetical protein